MTVLVEMEGTARAVITLVPSRLGRLFGRRTRRGVAVRISGTWQWETTHRDVDHEYLGYPIRRALETQVVADVPRATARRSP